MNAHGIDDDLYRDAVASPYARLSFAQEAEDLLLTELLDSPPGEPGFYVDIGAHHPIRFSTTYLFYLRGWSGLNVDAAPGSMSRFARHRPRDINLEYAVSDRVEDLAYFQFSEAALNTLDPERVRLLAETSPYRPESVVHLTTIRLDTLLERHLPAGQRIDFLTVDVEDLDERVLRSNDWDRFRPRFLVAEDRASVTAPETSAINRYLADQGYRLVARTPRSGIHTDMRST